MKLIIDCDPGLGSRGSDVDDGLALFILLNNRDQFNIEGITTIFGNTNITKGFTLLKKYLEFKDCLSITHYKGAANSNDLGKSNQAVEFLIEQVKRYPDQITLLSLGPLTNIATAIKIYPDFIDDLKEFIFMGGVINPSSAFSPQFTFGDSIFITNEFNFNQDPIATKLFIETKTQTPRVGFGLDICCQAIFKEEHLDMIKNVNKTPYTEFLIKYIEPWLNLWQHNLSNGFYPFDAFLPIYLLEPDLFSFKDFYLKVDTEEEPGKLIKHKTSLKNSKPITYSMNFSKSDGPSKFMEKLIANLIK